MTERPDQPGQKPDQRDLDAAIEAAAGNDGGATGDGPILDKPLEDPPPRLDSPAYSVPTPARSSRRALWFGVSAIVLIGAGAAVWRVWGDRIGVGTVETAVPAATAPAADRLTALEARIAANERKIQSIEGHLAALSDGGGASGPDEGVLDDLRGQIDALRERQGALEENLANTEDGGDGETAAPADDAAPANPAQPPAMLAESALTARLAALEAKLAQVPAANAEALAALERDVAALKTAGAATDTRITAETERLRAVGRGVALVYAIGRLRGAVATEAPFTDALETVRGHFQALDLLREPAIEKALTALAGPAAKGLPDRASLAARFGTAARAALQASHIPEDSGMVDRLLAEAGNLVTVRPIGEIEGDTVEARLARAETRLSRGDLGGALGEIAGIDGGAAAALAPWKADAEARLAAEAAVELLDGEVSARFAEAE